MRIARREDSGGGDRGGRFADHGIVRLSLVRILVEGVGGSGDPSKGPVSVGVVSCFGRDALGL